MVAPRIPSEFVRPAAVNVSCVLAAALESVGLATPNGAASREALELESAEKVCVVLVDGLGAANLAARQGHAPTLRHLNQREPITTIAPSTTAAAITSVGTGLCPGQTSMLGYSLRSPHTGNAFSLIKWEEPGLDPRTWQTQPTLFETVDDAGACVVVQPRAFVGSGLTEAALRGARPRAAESLDERVDAAVGELRRGARCVYLYWGDIDHVGHNRGWMTDEWGAELEVLDAAIRQLLRRLPKGTLVMVTADHGMIDTDDRIDVAENFELLCGVQLMAGEDRAIQLYTDEPDIVAERWRNALGDKAWVLTRDEAITENLFGPVTEHSASVIGDVFSFQTGRTTILDSRLRRPGSPMVGVHGSLTADEMYVPLIVEMV